MSTQPRRITRALLSVSDKAGLLDFAKSLAGHSDLAIREFAVETLKEIETFKIAEDSYAYVFYVLQRTN